MCFSGRKSEKNKSLVEETNKLLDKQTKIIDDNNSRLENTNNKLDEVIKKCKIKNRVCNCFCKWVAGISCLIVVVCMVAVAICACCNMNSGRSYEYTVHINGDVSPADGENNDQAAEEGGNYNIVISDQPWAYTMCAAAVVATATVCATVITCCVVKYACKPKNDFDNSEILLEAYEKIIKSQDENKQVVK